MSWYVTFGCGVLTTLGGIAAVWFLRFWYVTHDRFFLFFTGAFALLALDWLLLALVDVGSEARPFVYLFRLAAFVLILVAIADKNRRA